MSVATTVKVLRSLAQRVTSGNGELTAATGVMGDVGRALATVDEKSLLQLQAAMASLRERLELASGNVESRPYDALLSDKGHTFLAGALWAANDITSAMLAEQHRQKAELSRGSARAGLRSLALDLLGSQATVTPSEIAAHAEQRGLSPRADQISRALRDLLDSGEIVPAATPKDKDGRGRYFARVPHMQPTPPLRG